MLKKIKDYYNWGGRFLNDPYHIENKKLNNIEFNKQPLRFDVINYLLKNLNRETTYLEIGVRNPEDNYNKILATKKYSVDPGIEFKENPVDFKMTSDDFFTKLENGDILTRDTRFDIIFIDGLHLAEQVDRDIKNALKFIHEDGFIVLHDCNPPSEWHARETHKYEISPAMQNWNGTTWKAYVKYRNRPDLFTCCIDTDWGIGIISFKIQFGKKNPIENPFYEYNIFSENREESLNLISYEEFNRIIELNNE